MRLCARLVLVAVLMPTSLIACEFDLERVRVFIPFDAGPLDDEAPLCDVKVRIDLTDDGEVDLERTYHFAQDGTLRRLEENLAEGVFSSSELDEPLDPFAPPRETLFAIDDTVAARVVAKSRLDPTGPGASHVAKAGFVDDRLRTLEITGEDFELGPANFGGGAEFIQATASWRSDTEAGWNHFEFENRYVTKGEDGVVRTSTYGEAITFSRDAGAPGVFSANARTQSTSDGFQTSVREFDVVGSRDADGIARTFTVTDLSTAVPYPITVDVERTPEIDVLTRIEGGFVTASVHVEKSARGHAHRVWAPGSSFFCRTAVTDPLGTPLWLRIDASSCVPLVEEVRGASGFVERVVMTSRTVTFTVESTCDDVCTLREARALDDGSMLAIADAVVYVSPIRVMLRAEQNAVVDNAPSCEVSP